MDSHNLRIHWNAEDLNHKSNPGISESTPPVLLWLMLMPLVTNWHLWGNPPTHTPPFITPHMHTYSVHTQEMDWPHSQGLRGYTLKGLSLFFWQIVKKQVFSISENHALVWIPLLGSCFLTSFLMDSSVQWRPGPLHYTKAALCPLWFMLLLWDWIIIGFWLGLHLSLGELHISFSSPQTPTMGFSSYGNTFQILTHICCVTTVHIVCICPSSWQRLCWPSLYISLYVSWCKSVANMPLNTYAAISRHRKCTQRYPHSKSTQTLIIYSKSLLWEMLRIKTAHLSPAAHRSIMYHKKVKGRVG